MLTREPQKHASQRLQLAWRRGASRPATTNMGISGTNFSGKDGEYHIVIVDDHPILRSSIRIILQQDTNYKIAGEASDGAELMELLAKRKVDLIILDLNMPKMNGLQTLEILAKKYPGIATIVLTSHKERALLRQAIAKGAKGYLLKEDTHEILLKAIRDIRQGKRAISPELTSVLLEDYAQGGSSPAEDPLTNREKNVLHLLVNGLKSREIAERLGISPRTVDTMRIRIREKLDATTMAELIQYAKDHNLM